MESPNIIEKVSRLTRLYDFYAALLTPRQRQMFELHYFEDWSYAEIGEHLTISRQAVYDQLARVADQLEHYEELLGLVFADALQRDRTKNLVATWAEVKGAVSPLLQERMEASIREIQHLLDAGERGDSRV
ncbi:MAG: hypothetical protein OWS03_06350 [Alicyclobacillaceae bacterium]|uniref:YlxM family DNA-binding protein n=1 Tax=Alicyclobacillus sp. SP_1 TaxID=2942475 RepID=UPI002157D3BD|nr:sigma factor-like helix-turn-helix DNA-binding protein [Alicyclobacillus sp. SP_1]MCY0895901.1 hypothetical protein [Alicyclobacillaceae bacterium]